MRHCIFLLADNNMRAVFEGFLTRSGAYHSLGCGRFDFDTASDIKVAAGDNDPGLFTRGHELLRPFLTTHQRAVVVLDAEWEGSPGAQRIRQHLTQQLQSTGWPEAAFRIIVIEPELESWIWQQSDHVAKALGFDSINTLMKNSDIQHAWPNGSAKPDQPKLTLETLLRKQRIPRSSAIYRRITSQVSVKNCQDNAFQELLAALRSWFPPKGG